MSHYLRDRDRVTIRPGRTTYAGFKAQIRGLTRSEFEELPDLGQPFQAACAPLATLYDESWFREPDVRRQMVGLCLRCPLRATCPERKT